MVVLAQVCGWRCVRSCATGSGGGATQRSSAAHTGAGSRGARLFAGGGHSFPNGGLTAVK